MNFLKGKKTYIVSFLMVIVHGLYFQGTIDKETHDYLFQLLGAGALATLSAKINRNQEQ